ncbi:DUF483 domain-containing protein [Nanoarchaeota archaeon]
MVKMAFKKGSIKIKGVLQVNMENMETNLELHSGLKKIFSSYQDILEVLLTYHSHKRACRLVVSEDELRSISTLCEKNRLFMAVQDFKIVERFDKGKGGALANRSDMVALNNNDGKYLVYISMSREDALQAKEYEKINHPDFGIMLGYPKCCVEYYLKNIKTAARHQGDLIVSAIKDLAIFPFVNNFCLRYFGISILSHFPCSFDCERSRTLGERFLKVLGAYAPELKENYERVLKSFVLYTEEEGIFFTSDYEFKSGRINYRNIKGSVSKGRFFDELRSNTSIVCDSFSKFTIGKTTFDGGGFVIMFG